MGKSGNSPCLRFVIITSLGLSYAIKDDEAFHDRHLENGSERTITVASSTLGRVSTAACGGDAGCSAEAAFHYLE